MSYHRRWMMVLLMVTLIGGLAACQTPAGRSTGMVVDDATITSKIKAKLIADESLSVFGIDVDTFDGKVTMTGGVDTQAEKNRATRIAESVQGVKAVHNLVQIKR